MRYEGFTRSKTDPSLRTEVKMDDGDTVIHYLCHPDGPRRERRYKRRHHPFFTKTRTGGREWEIMLREHNRKRDG